MDKERAFLEAVALRYPNTFSPREINATLALIRNGSTDITFLHAILLGTSRDMLQEFGYAAGRDDISLSELEQMVKAYVVTMAFLMNNLIRKDDKHQFEDVWVIVMRAGQSMEGAVQRERDFRRQSAAHPHTGGSSARSSRRSSSRRTSSSSNRSTSRRSQASKKKSVPSAYWSAPSARRRASSATRPSPRRNQSAPHASRRHSSSKRRHEPKPLSRAPSF